MAEPIADVTVANAQAPAGITLAPPTEPNARVLAWLPSDGSWRTEQPGIAQELRHVHQQRAHWIQFRNRDGLAQYRLTPAGISARQAIPMNP